MSCFIETDYLLNTALNKTLLNKYLDLPQPENVIQAEYIWIDDTGEGLRCKTKTLEFVPKHPSELPTCTSYDGNYQADGAHSDIFLYPVAIYNDPFRRGNNKLVLCDTYYSDKTPTKTNKRYRANKAMETIKDQDPWFGIEQEYTLINFNSRPFGWPKRSFPCPQSPYYYYCGVGANKVIGREIVEAHYRACLYAGVKIAGTNAEMLSQWKFQVGPCVGINAGDDLWIARFILHRIAEEYGVIVTLDSKSESVICRNWYAYHNFSTKAMRGENGIAEIEKATDKLYKQHLRYIQAYDPRGGKDNERRLIGKCKTSNIHNFRPIIVANRNAANRIRIPNRVAKKKKGYLKDRRPSSNCDPYSVCDALVRICVLNE